MPQPTQGQRKSKSVIVQAANSRSNSAKHGLTVKTKRNSIMPYFQNVIQINRNINNQIRSDCFCSGRQVQNQWVQLLINQICCQTSNIALCRGGNINFSRCLTQTSNNTQYLLNFQLIKKLRQKFQYNKNPIEDDKNN